MHRKFLTFFLFIISFQFTCAQNEFITIWKPWNIQTGPNTGIPYNSSSTQVWFPGKGTNYTLSWEEIGYPSHNVTLTNVTSAYQILIDFGTSLNPDPQNATYRIKVSNGNGNFQTIQFTTLYSGVNVVGDTKKIIDIEHWGTIEWTSMENAFSGCSLMDMTATDSPNLSKVDNMAYMFFGCSNLVATPAINNWNISNVTNLRGTFMASPLFNQPLGNWDTSNVEDMAYTFLSAATFNQPIGNWNTSKVKSMIAMFNDAEEFNQPIGSWDLSQNINCEFMFSDAHKFNQPIGNWNISKLTETDHMFNNAFVFNQDIGNWDTSNVKIMSGMFNNAIAFNQNIRNWNVSNVTNMSVMFQNATSFNQDIGIWNVSSVKSLVSMFNNATNFNQNLGQWNLSSLLFAQNMFLNSGLNCEKYNNILQGWNNNTATPNNINIGNASPLVYSTIQAVNARNNLINNKAWTITGDAYNAECSLLSTSENLIKNEVNIYPNPATDFIYATNLKGSNTYKIFDTSGRIVLKDFLNDKKINISSLIKGNYILQIISNDKIQSFKFIKK